MTPEHKFTMWVTVLTGLPTIVFTGVVAFWTWWRDQERIIVHKSPTYWETEDGTRTNETLCGVGIIVSNLSLYPVRIAGLMFVIDGKKTFPFDRRKHQKEWPVEIASHARMIVRADAEEWERLETLGLRERIMDWQFVALARTETGGRFFSNRPRVRIMRVLKAARNRLKRQSNARSSALRKH